MPKYKKIRLKDSNYLKMIKSARMWIDGTTFNIRREKLATGDAKFQDGKESPGGPDDIKQDNLFNINADDNGKFSTSFRMPNFYYSKLHSNPTFMPKCTNTKLTIPNQHKGGNMSIIGEKYEDVANAREELHTCLYEIRSKSAAKQFISIPTNSDEIKTNFKKFKEDILKCSKDVKGLDESIFQKPEKLHITVMVFSLFDQTEEAEAIKVLNSCKENVIDKMIQGKGPLKIRLKGLDFMETNVKSVNILYAKAQFEEETEECNLQKMANDIKDYFYQKGFDKEGRDSVKIHSTLINTRYRKVEEKNRRGSKRVSFDATQIVEKYKDYDFGTCTLESVHLSIMGSKGDDGFYLPLMVIYL